VGCLFIHIWLHLTVSQTYCSITAIKQQLKFARGDEYKTHSILSTWPQNYFHRLFSWPLDRHIKSGPSSLTKWSIKNCQLIFPNQAIASTSFLGSSHHYVVAKERPLWSSLKASGICFPPHALAEIFFIATCMTTSSKKIFQSPLGGLSLDSIRLFDSSNHAFTSHSLLTARPYTPKPMSYSKFESRKLEAKKGIRIKLGNIILPHLQVVFWKKTLREPSYGCTIAV
jgi:hypothetical protein